MMNGHTSLEKYTSHFIQNGWKGLWKGCVREVSWRLNKLPHIDPPPSSFVFSSTSFSFCWASQLGVLGAHSPLLGAGSLYSILSPTQLTRTSCGTRLYNCLMPTCFSERHICTQFNPSIVKVVPWYLQLDAPVIYTGASLIWQLGRGQYVTLFFSLKTHFLIWKTFENPNWLLFWGCSLVL